MVKLDVMMMGNANAMLQNISQELNVMSALMDST